MSCNNVRWPDTRGLGQMMQSLKATQTQLFGAIVDVEAVDAGLDSFLPLALPLQPRLDWLSLADNAIAAVAEGTFGLIDSFGTVIVFSPVFRSRLF
jgi:hypothetical protein